MKLITNALIYKAQIPNDPVLLAMHLAEHPFTPPSTYQARSAGFVPVHDGDTNLIETFPGGLAFKIRVDDKIMPGAVVRAEHQRRIENVKKHFGRKPGKKERAQLKDDAVMHLLSIAMVKTTAVITCYYHLSSSFLIVPVSAKKLGDLCTHLLIQAVGSVKTETIHVADVKHGLTTRLKAWLADSDSLDAFGEFRPCDQVVLEAQKRRVSVRMGELGDARKGLAEALTQGFTVRQLGLAAEGFDFGLTEGFQLRGITHSNMPEEIEGDQWWPIEARAQVGNVVLAVEQLIQLLSYRPPETAETAEEVTS